MTLLLMLACAGRRNPNGVELPDIAPQDYPSFEQLVAAHEAFVGGDKATSDDFYMKQLISAPAQGLTGEIEIWTHQGQVYTRSFIQGMGESTSGWTGQYGWPHRTDPQRKDKGRKNSTFLCTTMLWHSYRPQTCSLKRQRQSAVLRPQSNVRACSATVVSRQMKE